MRQKFRRWLVGLLTSIVRDVLLELQPPPIKPDVDDVLRTAYTECGLAADSYGPNVDLLHSGKLHEVLIHSARKLGNPLITIADVAALLK